MIATRRASLPAVFFALGAALLALPSPCGAVGVQVETVYTSVAFGTFTPPPLVGAAPQKIVAAATPLSASAHNPADPKTGAPYPGAVDLIRDTSALFDGAGFGAQLAAEHGTLGNFDLLTGELLRGSRADDQIRARMAGLLAELRAAYPTVEFAATVGLATYLGTEGVPLYGGSPQGDPVTVVLGQAQVEVYRLDVTVTVASPIEVETQTVNTTVGFGTFTPPVLIAPDDPSGSRTAPQKLVTTGTPLSAAAFNLTDPATGEPFPGVIDFLRDSSALFDGAGFGDPLEAEHGTRGNLAFLTEDLPQAGNAGDQLRARMEQQLADLHTAFPTVEFGATVGAATYLGNEVFSLYGGMVPGENPGDPVTVIVGTADVALYRLDVVVGLEADVVIDHRIVDTSVAFGSFVPPVLVTLDDPLGSRTAAQMLVAAGTPLSAAAHNPVDPATGAPYLGVADQLRDASPLFDGAIFGNQLAAEHGSLGNPAFLTEDLPQAGNAGDQLRAQMEQRLADLRAAFPTIDFGATIGSATFLGTESISLYGGAIPGVNPGDPVTLVTGTANVDLYRLDVDVSLDSAVVVENHIVDTSAARGTFTLPRGFGEPIRLVAAGTPLCVAALNPSYRETGEPDDSLADVIRDSHPLFGPPYGDRLVTEFATIGNLEFLTADLPQYRNAGQQLDDQMGRLLADLRAAYPGVAFAMNPPLHTFTGTESYGLFGGTVPGDNVGDPVTVHVGTANVDFYQVDAEVTITGPPRITRFAFDPETRQAAVEWAPYSEAATIEFAIDLQDFAAIAGPLAGRRWTGVLPGDSPRGQLRLRMMNLGP